jgi:Pyridoxamine 5'-phosphate oxidase
VGKVYERIEPRLRAFVLSQPLFFVATAPSGPDGHVNLSPKGMQGCFAVLSEDRVAYLDFTGSGAETSAHLRDNGRITIMFCAFTGPPKIVRFHGQGRYIRPDEPDFAPVRRHFESAEEHGVRGIIEVAVTRVSDSCGYSVPYLEYVGERGLLTEWASHRTDEELVAYREKKNLYSIDGMPALA